MQLDDDKLKLEVLRYKNEGCSQSRISEITGIPKTTLGNFLRKSSYKEWWSLHEKPIASGQLYDHHTNMRKMRKKCYIAVSAQNNTFVHKNFWDSILKCAEYNNAEILVGTYSYNINGFQNFQKGDGEWFDPLIVPYIVDEPIEIAEGLVWCGELNVLPTAVNPLSGFHSYTKDSSGIIPHAKVQMESLPSHQESDPRFLYTTGTVTQRNYIQKKAGQKASFHHVFGALLIEVDNDGDWFVRQLIADTDSGEFYDLDVLYTPECAYTGNRIEGINYGDIHAEKVDPVVANISWGDNESSMLNVLKPKYQFAHDVMDFTTRNHHTIGNIYSRFASYVNDKDLVENDVKSVAQVLNDMNRDYCQTVVVESNHDLAMKRWLATADYRNDPPNALLFLKLQYASYQAITDGNYDFNVFEYAVKTTEYDLNDILFLKTDQSFVICGDNGINAGMHGDLGANGSRGSAISLSKIGQKINIGHSHSAKIYDGVYQAGHCMDLSKVGYNKGPSSWSHTHIVTYQNSKRAIVTIKNGKWRAS